MTADDFAAFLRFAKDRYGWSGAEVGRQLGIAPNTVKHWRERGAPLYIGLACSAIAIGLPPWSATPPNKTAASSGRNSRSR